MLGTSTGGVGTHVRALARDLSASHEVAIAAPPSTLEHFSLPDLPGVRPLVCHISTQMHPRDASSIRELRGHIGSFSPDVIHAHGFRAGLLTLLARGSSPVPVVVSWHNQASGAGWRRRVQQWVESYIARRADLTLGASEDLAERARQVGGSNVEFAPVAAPELARVPAQDAAALRRELLGSRPDGAVLGLLVGRIAPQKNYPLLIEAATHLTDLPVTFVIAGAADEDLLSELRQTLARTDLGGVQIEFLGPRSDVGALMAAADLYVLTSHWEARALVLQEALIAGLPIVASDAGGIPELVGDAGVLIDPHSPAAPEEFAGAIRSLMDPAARTEWGRRAAERGATLPDEAEVAATLESHYERLIRR